MKLEATDLSFGYPDRTVGWAATLAIEPGEVL